MTPLESSKAAGTAPHDAQFVLNDGEDSMIGNGDYDFDDQDQSEVFDEDNQSLDGAGDISADMMTLEELPDVIDVTSAVGDADDDAALFAEDLDDDDIIALEADAELADLEDDELAARGDDWLAEDDADEGEVAEIGVASEARTFGVEDDSAAADETRAIAAVTAEDAELEFTDDVDDLPESTGRTSARMESSRELSEEDLEELGYRDEKGPV